MNTLIKKMSMPYVKCSGPERFQMLDFWNVFIHIIRYYKNEPQEKTQNLFTFQI